MSVAATTRVEKLQYKEILTPRYVPDPHLPQDCYVAGFYCASVLSEVQLWPRALLPVLVRKGAFLFLGSKRKLGKFLIIPLRETC